MLYTSQNCSIDSFDSQLLIDVKTLNQLFPILFQIFFVPRVYSTVVTTGESCERNNVSFHAAG